MLFICIYMKLSGFMENTNSKLILTEQLAKRLPFGLLRLIEVLPIFDQGAGPLGKQTQSSGHTAAQTTCYKYRKKKPTSRTFSRF